MRQIEAEFSRFDHCGISFNAFGLERNFELAIEYDIYTPKKQT